MRQIFRSLPTPLAAHTCSFALSMLFTLCTLVGCADQTETAEPKLSNVMELTISGLGTNHAQTEVKWLDSNESRNAATLTKSTASTVPLTGFLDVAGVSTSTLDAGGTRYISTRIKVRNAPACGLPPVGGTCAPYITQRRNVTFFAVIQPSTINQTAVSRFKRFDGSDANFALTTSLLPAHAIDSGTQRVHPLQASMQVFNESELPPAEPGVTSVLPYGFVVKNVNNGSRILPASPANNQYDGEVTFGFSIPIQALPTDDPFKISLRFQTADDFNTRVTQSTHEQDSIGDLAATSRAVALASSDLTVLGGRIAQTPIGNPICQVRTAGLPGAETAFLVNQIPATPLVRAAPQNLSFVERNSEVSLGFCEFMTPPTAASFVVNGSQSGRRVVGGAYGGLLTGGGASAQRNQLVWNISGHRPFFPNEEVSVSATANNTNFSAVPITPFVTSFRVKGSANPVSGTISGPNNYVAGAAISAVTLADFNGDGKLDIAAASRTGNSVSVFIGNGLGGFSAATNFAVASSPIAIASGDVNGDGKLDIVTANFSGANHASVLLGNGIGGFAAAFGFPLGGIASSVALGDVNGDGHLDITVANFTANAVSIALGNGIGGFSSATSFAAGGGTSSVALGDFNADGKLDIAATNFNASTASILIGNGSGGFASASNIAVGTNPNGVATGDFNGDGKLDIVTSNQTSSNVSVLLGNGSGGFAAVSNTPVADSPYSVSVGDINGDGRLDLVLTNYLVNRLSIMFGNGNGGFSNTTSYATANGPFAATFGDLNDDGKLDVVTGNFNSNNVSALLGL